MKELSATNVLNEISQISILNRYGLTTKSSGEVKVRMSIIRQDGKLAAHERRQGFNELEEYQNVNLLGDQEEENNIQEQFYGDQQQFQFQEELEGENFGQFSRSNQQNQFNDQAEFFGSNYQFGASQFQQSNNQEQFQKGFNIGRRSNFQETQQQNTNIQGSGRSALQQKSYF